MVGKLDDGITTKVYERAHKRLCCPPLACSCFDRQDPDSQPGHKGPEPSEQAKSAERLVAVRHGGRRVEVVVSRWTGASVPGSAVAAVPIVRCIRVTKFQGPAE